MPHTVQTIIDLGFAKSRYSRPEFIAEQTEALVALVDRTQKALFAFAARVNDTFFAEQAEVSQVSGGWTRPTAAESVFLIEGVGGQTTPAITGEVLVVPLSDRAPFAGAPSVYRFGQRYFGAGNSGDPTGGKLRFFYSRIPATLSALSDPIDSAFPDHFTPIFEYEVAAFNAMTDGGRDGEMALMTSERDKWISLFEMHLEHETAQEVRRTAKVAWTPEGRRKPLGALIGAGGA